MVGDGGPEAPTDLWRVLRRQFLVRLGISIVGGVGRGVGSWSGGACVPEEVGEECVPAGRYYSMDRALYRVEMYRILFYT
jgi:hypothetical protein